MFGQEPQDQLTGELQRLIDERLKNLQTPEQQGSAPAMPGLQATEGVNPNMVVPLQEQGELPADSLEDPHYYSSLEYLFGKFLPTNVETNAIGTTVAGDESRALPAAYGQFLNQLTGIDTPEGLDQRALEQMNPAVRWLVEAREVGMSTLNQAVGSTVAAVDIVGGLAGPLARAVGQGLMPGVVSTINDIAHEYDVTFDQAVQMNLDRAALDMGMEPETLKKFIPDRVFADIMSPADPEHPWFGYLGEQAFNVYGLARSLIEFPLHKAHDIAEGDVLTDPVGIFLAFSGAKHGGQFAYRKWVARRNRKAGLNKIVTERPVDIQKTVEVEVAKSIDADGKIQTAPGAVMNITADAAQNAIYRLRQNANVRPGEQFRLVFDAPEGTKARGVFLPDFVRVAENGDLAMIVETTADGRVIGRKQNGKFVEIPEGPMTAEQAAQTAIPIPDPVLMGGEWMPRMQGRLVLDSEVGLNVRAGKNALEFTRNPTMLEQQLDQHKPYVGPNKPTELATLGDTIRAELSEQYGPIFDHIELLDEWNHLQNPEYLSMLDNQRQRVWEDKGRRVPLWTMSGFGIPMQLKSAKSVMSFARSVLTTKSRVAYDKMGIYEVGLLKSKMSPKLVQDMQNFRAQALPILREPMHFLAKFMPEEVLSRMTRPEMIDIVMAKLDRPIRAHLERVGRGGKELEANLARFREGAYDVGFLSDHMFMLNSMAKQPGMPLSKFRRDYMTHVKPRFKEVGPDARLEQAFDDAHPLPKEWEPWFQKNRSRNVSAVEAELADPLVQDQLAIDMNLRAVFLEPVKRQVEIVNQMTKEGINADLLIEAKTGHPEVGQTFHFEPSPRLAKAEFEVLVGEDVGFKPSVATNEKMGLGETYRFVGTKELPSGSTEYRFEVPLSDGTSVPKTVTIPKSMEPAKFWENFVARAPKARRERLVDWANYNLVGTTPHIKNSSKVFASVYNGVRNRVPSSMKWGPAKDITPLEMQHAVTALVSTLHAKHLGMFRLSSPLKNLTQAPTLGASIVGWKHYRKAFSYLKDPTIRGMVENLGARSAHPVPMSKINADGQKHLRGVLGAAEAINGTLKMFGMADTVNRTTTQASAIARVMEEKADFVPNLPSEGYNNLIRRKIAEEKYMQAAYIYAHGAEALSQWWYAVANRPEFYLDSEFLTMFGTWPLNFMERIVGEVNSGKQYAAQVRGFDGTGKITPPKGPIKNPQVKNGMRYLATSLAFIAGGGAVGANLWSWYLFGPMSTSVGAGLDTVEKGIEFASDVYEGGFDTNADYAQRQMDAAWRDILSMIPANTYENVDGEFEFFDLIAGTGIGRDIKAFAETGAIQSIIFGSGATSGLRRKLTQSGGRKRPERPVRPSRKRRF